MSEASAILEGFGLVKHFGGGRHLLWKSPVVHAVDDVSISVNRQETFAIVGESGCGKSTLGRLLLRLIEATAGRVTFEGRDLRSLSATELRELRRDMQIIFQDPFSSLNPRMTVADIVGEPIWLHGLSDRQHRAGEVAELLRTVGLRPEYAGRYPHEFSGGQRQRIGVARALASNPRLIVGDEPVSALDVSIQAQIINLLEELKERLALTLIVIAHDLAVIRHMSDRVAVMYLGEIVELAPVEALFETPLHPYTQALVEAIPSRTPSQRRERRLLQGDVPNPAAPPPGCRFHTRCPHARPLCREARPAAEQVGDDRRVACHYWREIQNLGASPPMQPPTSPGLDRRLALYRQRQLDNAT